MFYIICDQNIYYIIFFEDALIEKYGNTLDVKKLPGQVGMWLSRAGDREGGRKQREKNVDNV